MNTLNSNPNSDNNEISLVDLFQFIKRGLAVAILTALAFAAGAYFLSRSRAPVYKAQATILAATTNSSELNNFGVSLATAPPIDVNAYEAAAKSYQVVENAFEVYLGKTETLQDDVTNLLKDMTVRTETNRTSSLIKLYVDAPDNVIAANRANAVAAALVDWDKQRATNRLDTIISTLQRQIAGLEEKIRTEQLNESVSQEELNSLVAAREAQRQSLNSAETLRTSAIGQLEVLEQARAPLEPVSPNPTRDAALAFILGGFLSYAVMLVRNALNTRMRTTDALANVSGLPILAEFPRLPGGSRRLPLEASSYLRTNLLFAIADAHPKVILVTSSQSSEGKSSVSLNLAESFARNDYRTLLIDADLRKPVIAGEYSIRADAVAPLQAFLENPGLSVRPAKVMVDSRHALEVIPTFKPAPSPVELLSRSFRECLDTWRQQYDVIIVDSAPLLPVADTLTIAPYCTATLLVASMKAADKRNIQATTGILQRMGVRILGIAATQLDKESSRGGKRGYGYGYGYGYGDAEATAQPVASNTATGTKPGAPVKKPQKVR